MWAVNQSNPVVLGLIEGFGNITTSSTTLTARQGLFSCGSMGLSIPSLLELECLFRYRPQKFPAALASKIVDVLVEEVKDTRQNHRQSILGLAPVYSFNQVYFF